MTSPALASSGFMMKRFRSAMSPVPQNLALQGCLLHVLPQGCPTVVVELCLLSVLPAMPLCLLWAESGRSDVGGPVRSRLGLDLGLQTRHLPEMK